MLRLIGVCVHARMVTDDWVSNGRRLRNGCSLGVVSTCEVSSRFQQLEHLGFSLQKNETLSWVSHCIFLLKYFASICPVSNHSPAEETSKRSAPACNLFTVMCTICLHSGESHSSWAVWALGGQVLYTGKGLLFDLQLGMRSAEVISAQQRLLCALRAFPVKPGSRSSNGTKINK